MQGKIPLSGKCAPISLVICFAVRAVSGILPAICAARPCHQPAPAFPLLSAPVRV
jgi:hypothetical protein